ncbi:THAP domain-containing protein 5-like [Plutella xylostella]|uniref:THAP domain-containing protein 5-like n=1 Tax=Plutella xylostella TaxID=51655 RepID=UPI0020323996|nr:THAP domain-containing protein 5-like [Plutella xylostella]
MRVCAINVCRNYKGRLKTTHKVTFHAIPTDPVIKSKWIDIIRKSRGEDYWKPTKNTVVCSDHFHNKDIYIKNQTGPRRLKKGVVPCKALFLFPATSEGSASSDEEAGEIKDGYTKRPALHSIFLSSPNSQGSAIPDDGEGVINDGFTKQLMPSTSKKIENNNSEADDQPLSSAAGTSTDVLFPSTAKPSKALTDIEDFSDLDSVFDSPQEAKLRKELRKKTALQKKHILKIQCLRRKNLRLQRKLASFKQIIQTLKKERCNKE